MLPTTSPIHVLVQPLPPATDYAAWMTGVATVVLVGITWVYVRQNAAITKANKELADIARDSLTLNRSQIQEAKRREDKKAEASKSTALFLMLFFKDSLEETSRTPRDFWQLLKVRNWRYDDFDALRTNA